MAKMITFDLLLNGNKVKNLEELKDNFTFDTIAIARSGRLVKWLLSRGENELADKVKVAEELTEELELFKALASIFEIEYDEESLQEMYDEFLSMNKMELKLVETIESAMMIIETPCIDTEIVDNQFVDQQKVAENLLISFKSLAKEINSLWKKVHADLKNVRMELETLMTDDGSIFFAGICIPNLKTNENYFFLHVIDSCIAPTKVFVSKRKFDDLWNELQLSWTEIDGVMNKLYSNHHSYSRIKIRTVSSMLKGKLATIKEYENEIKNIGTKLFKLPINVFQTLMIPQRQKKQGLSALMQGFETLNIGISR
jgi:hypothetical protein